MLKESLIEQSVRSLGNTAGVRYYAKPESPFVIDNPDIIATCGNNIFGIFIPSKAELQDIDSLFRRIYVSRLVYARDLRCLLYLETDDIINDFRALKYSCHRLCFGDEINEINRIVEGDHSNMQRKMLSKGVRCHSANTYYAYMNAIEKTSGLNKVYRNLELGDLWEPIRQVNRWSDFDKQKSLKTGFESQDSILFQKKKGSSSFRQSMDNILTYALYRRFLWDDGRLYLSNDAYKVSMLNTDMELDIRQLSTLAYLGVLPVSADNEEAISLFQKQGFINNQ